MRATPILLALALGATGGCGLFSDEPPPEARALALCSHGVASIDDVANATLTTVGAVRALRAGPGQQPAANAFAGAPEDADAARCWSREGTGWRSYAAGPGGAVVELAHMSGMAEAPRGAPTIP